MEQEGMQKLELELTRACSLDHPPSLPTRTG